MKITWEEPCLRGMASHWQEFLGAVKANPGKSALMETHKAPKDAYAFANACRKTKAFQGFLITCAKDKAKNVTKVYVKYVGEELQK